MRDARTAIASMTMVILALTAGCFSRPEFDEPGPSTSTNNPSTTDAAEVEAVSLELPVTLEPSEFAQARANMPQLPSDPDFTTEAPTFTPTPANRDDEFELGDLVPDFEPPTLAELEADVVWKNRPVIDSDQWLREGYWAQQPPPIPVEDALALENDSDAANQKILNALGRLPTSLEEVDWNASMNRSTGGDVKSTNPLLISSTVEFDVQGLIGFGLFSFDWKMRPFAIAEHVESWQTSEDARYDKVVLRDDLTWSDGKPITAADIEFSYRLILSSKVPVPAVRSGTVDLQYVKAYDDRTVVFFHKEAWAANVWNVNFPVVPKHIYEESIFEDPTLVNSPYHVAIENKPVTGGPYVISARDRGSSVVLQRRRSYYMHEGKQVRPVPYLREVRFRVIENPAVRLLQLNAGDLDESLLTPEQWTRETTEDRFYRNNTKARDTEWVYFYFGWNVETAYFNDVRVRKAMSYAFDYDELLEQLRFGLDEPCNGIFHPESPWAPEDAAPPYHQDLDQAEDLLEEAGWTDSDGDGVRDKVVDGVRIPFEFTILVTNNPEREKYCLLLKRNLRQVGVECSIRKTEFTVMAERLRNHEFDACLAGWGTGTDPDTARNLWMTDEERNYVQYSDQETDALFNRGREELDIEKRRAIYGEIHKRLYEAQPYTWLFFRPSLYAFSKRVRGYNFSPRGPYNYGPGFSSIWIPAAK